MRTKLFYNNTPYVHLKCYPSPKNFTQALLLDLDIYIYFYFKQKLMSIKVLQKFVSGW